MDPYPPPSTELPKPPIPYIPGWKYRVQSHVPPAPTPVTSRCNQNSQSEIVKRRKLSPLERCLRNAPLDGPEPQEPLHTFELKIIHPIRIGDGLNSQVFIVKPSGTHPLPEDKTLVAKVYDPLYFDDDGGILNPFHSMNQFYTHEVRAYEMMAELQGHLVPRYYGSYTTEISIDSSTTRTVRLIIIEYIEGVSMLQVHPNGLSLRDTSPRNVMLLETTALDPKRHLVFVDFAGALFNRRPDLPFLDNVDFFLDQYVSPLLRWKRSKPMEFGDWADWDWKSWIEKEYAHTAGTITPEMWERYRSE